MGKLIERPWGSGNWNRFPSQTRIFSKERVGRVGRSTFLLGADPKLSGEGVLNGIYYCPLGFRATCTCMSLCTGLVILTSWLRAPNLSVVMVYYFTTLNCSRSLLLRYRKIDLRASQLRFTIPATRQHSTRKTPKNSPLNLPSLSPNSHPNLL